MFDIKKGTKFPKLDEEKWEKTIIQHFEKDKNHPEFSYWQYKRIYKN